MQTTEMFCSYSFILILANFIDLSSMHTLKLSFKYSIQLRQYPSISRELILNRYITFWIDTLALVINYIHIGSTVVKALARYVRGRLVESSRVESSSRQIFSLFSFLYACFKKTKHIMGTRAAGGRRPEHLSIT